MKMVFLNGSKYHTTCSDQQKKVLTIFLLLVSVNNSLMSQISPLESYYLEWE